MRMIHLSTLPSTPAIHLTEIKEERKFEIMLDKSWSAKSRKIVTTQLLGNAIIPDLPFQCSDSTPIRIDKGLLGPIPKSRESISRSIRVSGRRTTANYNIAEAIAVFITPIEI